MLHIDPDPELLRNEFFNQTTIKSHTDSIFFSLLDLRCHNKIQIFKFNVTSYAQVVMLLCHKDKMPNMVNLPANQCDYLQYLTVAVCG